MGLWAMVDGEGVGRRLLMWEDERQAVVWLGERPGTKVAETIQKFKGV